MEHLASVYDVDEDGAIRIVLRHFALAIHLLKRGVPVPAIADLLAVQATLRRQSAA